jgi:hypothetical protein
MRKILVLNVLILFIGGMLCWSALYPVNDEGNGSKEIVAQKDVSYRSKADKQDTNDPYVYITIKGKKYHRENCKCLIHSKIKIRLSEAKRREYKPCSKCKPPQ